MKPYTMNYWCDNCKDHFEVQFESGEKAYPNEECTNCGCCDSCPMGRKKEGKF